MTVSGCYATRTVEYYCSQAQVHLPAIRAAAAFFEDLARVLQALRQADLPADTEEPELVAWCCHALERDGLPTFPIRDACLQVRLHVRCAAEHHVPSH